MVSKFTTLKDITSDELWEKCMVFPSAYFLTFWINSFESFSDYTKITDGNGTEVLYHNGCNEKFAPEILFDVHFGLSNNISIQVYTYGSSSSIKIEYAILRQSLSSGKLTSAATQFFRVLIQFSSTNYFFFIYFLIFLLPFLNL